MMRRACHAAIDLLARSQAAWHVGRYRVLSSHGVMTFQHASEAISRVPFFLGYRVRQHFYQTLLSCCGPRLEMNLGAIVSDRGVRIGSDVWIGPYAYIDLADIDDYVLIGPQVCILAGGHHHRMDRTDIPIRQQGNHPLRRVLIGRGAWIGAHAVVMADVGEGAVVGAGAVVTHPVPSNAIVVGNPARVLRHRNQSVNGDVPGHRSSDAEVETSR